MAKYELLYVIPAKFTEPEVAALKEKIGGELTKLGASISRNDEIGKIRLGYAIENARHGHYILVEFEAETPVVAKVNEYLRLSTDVIRHQIVVPEKGAKAVTSLADPDARPERRDAVAVTASAPVPTNEPVSSEPALSQEEIDKKLNALEEDITKSL